MMLSFHHPAQTSKTMQPHYYTIPMQMHLPQRTGCLQGHKLVPAISSSPHSPSAFPGLPSFTLYPYAAFAAANCAKNVVLLAGHPLPAWPLKFWSVFKLVWIRTALLALEASLGNVTVVPSGVFPMPTNLLSCAMKASRAGGHTHGIFTLLTPSQLPEAGFTPAVMPNCGTREGSGVPPEAPPEAAGAAAEETATGGC